MSVQCFLPILYGVADLSKLLPSFKRYAHARYDCHQAIFGSAVRGHKARHVTTTLYLTKYWDFISL
jgi:hypothetical protein